MFEKSQEKRLKKCGWFLIKPSWGKSNLTCPYEFVGTNQHDDASHSTCSAPDETSLIMKREKFMGLAEGNSTNGLGTLGINQSAVLMVLVRVMGIALWSFIITLPSFIMHFSLCPIDCGQRTLSLNQFFREEKCFVYEQSLPSLLSVTAPAAALKWIRMKLARASMHGAGNLFSACSSHSIRHACLFPCQ